MVELVVAHRRRIVAQRPHGAQLRPLGGVQGLDQRADGEVSPVHRQRVGVDCPLPVQRRLQPGVAPRFPPVLLRLGQEVGVEIVGEEYCGAAAPGLTRQGGQQGAQQQNHCQKAGKKARALH